LIDECDFPGVQSPWFLEAKRIGYVDRRNLLEETLLALDLYGKSEADIKWVGSYTHRAKWKDFKKAADVVYDASTLSEDIVPEDLLIVGEDWWMERVERRLTRSWVFKRLPKEPKEKIKLKKLIGKISDNLHWINKTKVK